MISDTFCYHQYTFAFWGGGVWNQVGAARAHPPPLPKSPLQRKLEEEGKGTS